MSGADRAGRRCCRAAHPRVLLVACWLLWCAHAPVAAAGKDEGDDGPADREHPIVTPARVVVQDGRSVLRLDEQAVRRADIRTVALRRMPQRQSVAAYAVVEDLQGLGQELAVLQAAYAQRAAAQARVAASGAEYARARQLFEQDQNLSASQVQGALAAYSVDQAALAGAQAQVDAALVPLRLAWEPELLADLPSGSDAPTGLLGDLLARRRQLLRVIAPGATRTAAAPALLLLDDGTQLPLQYLGAALGGDWHQAGHALHYVAAARRELVAGASVPVELATGKSRPGVRVPGSAVIWWQGRAWYFERQANGDFVRREIAALQAGNAAGFVADLPDGAHVVTQGAQVLLSEELRAENFSTDVGGR